MLPNNLEVHKSNAGKVRLWTWLGGRLVGAKRVQIDERCYNYAQMPEESQLRKENYITYAWVEQYILTS